MMTKKLWAVVLIGVWLMGTVFMAVVATQNFYTLDRLLESSDHSRFQEIVETLGPDQAREFLRYFASELNRLYFQSWNIVQTAIGILALWAIVKLPDAQRTKWLVVAMLGIVLFLSAVITPQVLSIGRSLDFIPRNPPPPPLRTFALLHAAYTLLDAIKLLIGVVVLRRLWKNA